MKILGFKAFTKRFSINIKDFKTTTQTVILQKIEGNHQQQTKHKMNQQASKQVTVSAHKKIT